MEKKFVFVILHYYTIHDTIECVNSIKKLNGDSIEIVIVDNASPNETGKNIQGRYQKDDKVHVILSEKNLGFAKGNNIGFQFAKEELNADFIILCNNDTKVLQREFLTLVDNIYQSTSCSVLGPKIILKDGTINKLYLKLPTVKEFKKEIYIFKRNLLCNYLGIENIFRKVKKIFIKGSSALDQAETDRIHENIILHGCFLIFTPQYLKLFDGLDDRTFMYREEELLAIRLKKANLISLYNPSIEIFHAECGSTLAINKKDKKKRRFFYKNQIKSCNIVLQELMALNEEKK